MGRQTVFIDTEISELFGVITELSPPRTQRVGVGHSGRGAVRSRIECPSRSRYRCYKIGTKTLAIKSFAEEIPKASDPSLMDVPIPLRVRLNTPIGRSD